MEDKIVKVYVLKGLNGTSLVIENYRVSNEKIYGMLTPIYTFEVSTDDILQAIGYKHNQSEDCVSRQAVLDNIDSISEHHGGILDIRQVITQLPSATPTIPKNATNGDVVKLMFPDCKDWKAKLEDNDGEVYEVHFVQLPNSLTVNKYEESWWNAPYERVEDD